MHMADALISPAVGAVTWAVSSGAVALSSRHISKSSDNRQVPLMGVLGAFLFAAQMINFSIPGTGSSGHLGGGLLLTILLGPYAGLLVITSVLMVQALFFADGGLLALGCNILNMGVIPAFLVYPLVYRPVCTANCSTTRRNLAIMLSAVISLQLGPFCVVLETLFSGLTALPFSSFTLLMQPIHLAIGVVEGLITASVVSAVYQARPEIRSAAGQTTLVGSLNSLVVGLAITAAIAGGGLSLLASEKPDGLEWAIAKTTGAAHLSGITGQTHDLLARIQSATAFLPDYNLKKNEAANSADPAYGTSLSGLVGGMITLGILLLLGVYLGRRKARQDILS